MLKHVQTQRWMKERTHRHIVRRHKEGVGDRYLARERWELKRERSQETNMEIMINAQAHKQTFYLPFYASVFSPYFHNKFSLRAVYFKILKPNLKGYIYTREKTENKKKKHKHVQIFRKRISALRFQLNSLSFKITIALKINTYSITKFYRQYPHTRTGKIPNLFTKSQYI